MKSSIQFFFMCVWLCTSFVSSSGWASEPTTKTKPQAVGFGGGQQLPNSLTGTIYALPKSTKKLPTDWEKVEKLGTIFTQHLNVPPQSWTNGFPQVTDRFEWFAIVYQGSFHSARKACHQLQLISDDGSKLWIDNKLIIDHDGVHRPLPKNGQLCLEKGKHHLRLEYFQGPRVKIALQLFVLSNQQQGEKQEFFSHPDIKITSNAPFVWERALGFSCCLGVLLLLCALYVWRRTRKGTEKEKLADE